MAYFLKSFVANFRVVSIVLTIVSSALVTGIVVGNTFGIITGLLVAPVVPTFIVMLWSELDQILEKTTYTTVDKN